MIRPAPLHDGDVEARSTTIQCSAKPDHPTADNDNSLHSITANSRRDDVLTFSNPPAERILLIEQESSLRDDMCGSGDHGSNDSLLAIHPAERPDKAAADDRLHDMLLAFGELPVRSQAGKLCTRPRPARRTIIGLARTKHEVARDGFLSQGGIQIADLTPRDPPREIPVR